MTRHTDELHELLLRLAGRVPDEVMARARAQLATRRAVRAASTAALGVVERNVALDPTDLAILAGFGLDPDVLSDVDPELHPPVEYAFAPAPTGPFEHEPFGAGHSGEDPPDRAAVDCVASVPDARGLWRTWRRRAGTVGSPEPRRVYVVEVDADPVALTGALQRRLVDAGEPHPQVEAYLLGTEIPVYQRLARAGGDLMWARSPASAIRTAALFDGVDPQRGPYFRPDHERIGDEAERRRLADYLYQGELLMATTARMADVVDPSAQYAVPVNFRTDGTWLWTDATAYYLERHHLAPDPGLAAHVRARGYRPVPLDGVDIHRAVAALRAPDGAEPRWVFGRADTGHGSGPPSRRAS